MATIAGGAPDHVYAALAAFRRRHPGVQLALSEGVSRDLVRRVDAGELDVAVVGAAALWTPPRPSVVITDDALVAVVDPGHRLAGQPELDVTHFEGEALICMPRGTGIRDALDAAWPFPPEVALEVSTPAVIRTLAADGLGVGILAASMTIDARRLVTVPLVDARARSRLELIWAPCRAAIPPRGRWWRTCVRRWSRLPAVPTPVNPPRRNRFYEFSPSLQESAHCGASRTAAPPPSCRLRSLGEDLERPQVRIR